MAKNLNIGYSEVIKTSIMHTVENGRRFGSFGGMLSLRSAAKQPIINALSPVVAEEGGRLSFIQTGGAPVARVQLQWRPQTQAAGLSTTRRDKAGVIANAQNEDGVITENVDYVQHNEYSEGFTQVQLMKLVPAAESYLDAVNKGLTLNNPNSAIWQGLSEVGNRIMEKAETAIFQPLNQMVLTQMIAGIGKNLVDGSDATNLATVVLFDSEGRVKKDFLHAMNEIMRKHEMKTKPIVVGGTLMARWFDAMGWTATQDLGYDGDKMMRNQPFEFYYDSMIDTSYGFGQILIHDAGAAALAFVAEHGDVVKAKKVGDTTYTRASISLMGYDTEQTTIDLDLRIIESDAGAYPAVYVAPSLRAAIFTRPEGVIKTYGGFQDMTGIWGMRVVEFETDI